jgi:tellurite resistance protein TerC
VRASGAVVVTGPGAQASPADGKTFGTGVPEVFFVTGAYPQETRRREEARLTGESEALHWIVFFCIVAAALTIDLFFVGRKGDVVKTSTAYAWSAVWISLGVGFTGLVYLWYGAQAAQQYIAGYLIEESLSIDNLFVFLIVFGSLGIALRYQRKVLFWGILGAMVMRGAFIVAGVSLISRFEWIVYIFGALLVYTAYRLVRSHGVQVEPEKNPLVRFARRLFPVAADYEGRRFIIRRAGQTLITPLVIALVAIESADLVFAIDSVPAVLAVSDITFVVFTSNIAAILGLRSLYFALAGSLQRFEYLSWGLAGVLGFVGVKMLISHWVHIPILVSLGVIVVAIGASVIVSLVLTRGAEPDTAILEAAGHGARVRTSRDAGADEVKERP